VNRGAGNSFQNEFPQVIRSTVAGHAGPDGNGQKETGQKETDNDKSLVALVKKTLLGMRCPPTLSTIASSD
jgi:hypothetical protein